MFQNLCVGVLENLEPYLRDTYSIHLYLKNLVLYFFHPGLHLDLDLFLQLDKYRYGEHKIKKGPELAKALPLVN